MYKDLLTPYERIKSAVNFEEPDRVPILPLVTYALASHLGYTIYEYCHDPIKMAEAVIYGCKRFEYDSVLVYADVYLFAEAVGFKLEFPHDAVPKPAKSPIQNIDDVEKLEMPDPKKDGRLPVLIEAIETVYEKLGSNVPIYSGGQAPFSLAAEIRGLETFLKDIYLNKVLAEKLIDFCTDYMIELGEAEYEAGAKILHMGDSFAGPMVISPDKFKTFALKPNRTVYEKWRGLGAITSLHICGNSTPIWPYIPETKTQIFEVDHLVDLAKAKEFFNKKLCLMGNIDPSKIIHMGSASDVEAACYDCIDKAAAGGGYILSSGCLIMPGFPPRNLDILVSAAKNSGRYRARI